MRDMDKLVGHWNAKKEEPQTPKNAKKEEPQTPKEVCRFSVEGNCKILDKKCDGKKEKCSFFKTEEEYQKANDKAIRRCRELGLCNSCKYRSAKKCQLSDEPKKVKGVRND